MQDDANNNRRRVGKRPSYESQKISKALAEECSTAGIALETFLLQRPSERMKKLGMQDSEIPDERRYRDYWRRLKSEREDMADASEDSCRE